MKHEAPLPLVEMAFGRDQEDRADLYLAYRRCAQWRKVTPYNLHVRELLMYVCACDRDGRGVQKSYSEIADRLELCSPRAARSVIARASDDFHLLSVTEARYERGGQTANRYRVNWPLVRAIRDGLEDGRPAHHTTREPGDLQRHPGDAVGHGGDLQRHPYKEYSRTSTRTSNLHLNNTPPPTVIARSASSGTGGTQEEEGCFFEDGATGKQQGATGAQPLSPTAPPRHPETDRLDRLVDAYVSAGVYSAEALLGPLVHSVGIEHLEQLLAVWERSGDTLGAGALALRLRRARPQLSPSDGWPTPRRQRASDIPVTFIAGDPFRS